MLEEGLSYPSWGERWTGRFVIGSTLWLFGFLLIPSIVVYGYLMRAMGQTARGEDVPPQWSDWTGLVIEGLRAMVVSFVYALVPNILGGIVLFVVFLLFGSGGATGGDLGRALAGGGALVLIVGLLVVALVQAVVVFLLPAALINVNAENSLGAGFDFGAVTDIALSGAYLTALVHFLFVAFVTLTVGSVVSVTGILLPAVLFWGGLASARVFGLAYRGAMGEGGPTDATPARAPAAAAGAGAGAGAGAAASTGAGASADAGGAAGPTGGSDEDVSFSEPADDGAEPEPFASPGPDGSSEEEFSGTDEEFEGGNDGFEDENEDDGF